MLRLPLCGFTSVPSLWLFSNLSCATGGPPPSMLLSAVFACPRVLRPSLMAVVVSGISGFLSPLLVFPANCRFESRRRRRVEGDVLKVGGFPRSDGGC